MAELHDLLVARANRQAGRCVCGCGVFRSDHGGIDFYCYACGRDAPVTALKARRVRTSWCGCGTVQFSTDDSVPACPKCGPPPVWGLQ